jgi:PHS family inorganic phosphate transporter-like MFS transporter
VAVATRTRDEVQREPARPEQGVIVALNEAPLSRFHLRAALTAGMGFFTDAYDLFIIGIAMTLIKAEWNPSPLLLGLVGSTALLAAFLGATVFGRIADLRGRKAVYGLEAAVMAVAALATAFSPNLVWLLVWRFVLGIGIGGDYPVSAVLMSEYANRGQRGRLVSMVFSMQALGLIAGPIVALIILKSGVPHDLAWRLMLGLGAVPALAVIYLRRTLPESPRYAARVQGRSAEAAKSLRRYTRGVVAASEAVVEPEQRLTLRQFLSRPRYLRMLLGTAGTWFVFDYAYYGNTISTPLILKTVVPHASLIADTAIALLIFTVAALPGYVAAFLNVDRIGHRKLQIIGFLLMGTAFLLIGVLPGVTRLIVPFLVLYGVSYFFTEFGPNTTTFLLAAELYPVSARTTGHGLSAGMAKVGAFIGVLTLPLIQAAVGLSGVMLLAFAAALVGAALTLVLPEPSGQTLEEVSGEEEPVPTVRRLASAHA